MNRATDSLSRTVPPRPLLVEGDTCWRRVSADRAAVLIDAAAYFAALRTSLLQAERSIFILGWELSTLTRLRGETPPNDRMPHELGKFLSRLVHQRRHLKIRILLWDYALFYATARDLFPRLSFGWNMPRRLELVFDDHLPLGACHHEKLVVIDDAVAYCGGIDLTRHRWDTQEHETDDPRRRERGSKKLYGAVHDVQIVVDGEAAIALGQRVRERWAHATGERLPPPEPADDRWPEGVEADFERVPVGIMRTLGVETRTEEIREIERCTIAAIGRAERLIYIENQYLTAKSTADALVARMRANPDLEVVIITNYEWHGWIEAEAMGVGRRQFMAAFQEPHLGRRIHFLYAVRRDGDAANGPGSAEGEASEVPINFHAKVLVVDDTFLRIGSSNLNNRSMGFDTECDLGVEAEKQAHRRAIVDVRNRLMAEQWGTTPAVVARALESGKPPLDALNSVAGAERGVRELPFEESESDAATIITDLADPERVVTAERFVNDILGLKRRSRDVRLGIRALAIIAALAGLYLLWQALPFDKATIVAQVETTVESLRGSPWVIPVVIGVFVIGSLLIFPITVMIGTTILTLGPTLGFVCSVAGTLLGGAATYGVGHAIGRRALQRLLGNGMRHIDRKLEGRGIITVALIRKVPVAPFAIVNMMLGASGIRFRDFIAGTALGMVPGIGAFALVGDRLAEVWNDPNPLNVTLVAVAVAIWISIVLGMQKLVNRYRNKRR